MSAYSQLGLSRKVWNRNMNIHKFSPDGKSPQIHSIYTAAALHVSAKAAATPHIFLRPGWETKNLWETFTRETPPEGRDVKVRRVLCLHTAAFQAHCAVCSAGVSACFRPVYTLHKQQWWLTESRRFLLRPGSSCPRPCLQHHSKWEIRNCIRNRGNGYDAKPAYRVRLTIISI